MISRTGNDRKNRAVGQHEHGTTCVTESTAGFVVLLVLVVVLLVLVVVLLVVVAVLLEVSDVEVVVVDVSTVAYGLTVTVLPLEPPHPDSAKASKSAITASGRLLQVPSMAHGTVPLRGLRTRFKN